MWENAYLSIKKPKASRALKRALDPSCKLLASLARLRFATSATFGLSTWIRTCQHTNSAPGTYKYHCHARQVKLSLALRWMRSCSGWKIPLTYWDTGWKRGALLPQNLIIKIPLTYYWQSECIAIDLTLIGLRRLTIQLMFSEVWLNKCIYQWRQKRVRQYSCQ